MIKDAFESLNIVQEKNVFKKGGVVIDQARVSTALQGFAFKYNQNIPIVRGRKIRKPLSLDSIRKYFMGNMKQPVTPRRT